MTEIKTMAELENDNPDDFCNPRMTMAQTAMLQAAIIRKQMLERERMSRFVEEGCGYDDDEEDLEDDS